MPKKVAQDTGPGGVPALADAPWYVKFVIYILMWFGFPVAISVILLFVFIGYIPSPLTTLDKRMEGHVKDMERALILIEANQRVQRQICRNTSSNAAERVECDR